MQGRVTCHHHASHRIYLVDWNDLEERHFQLRRHTGIKLSSGDFLTFIIFLNDKKTTTGEKNIPRVLFQETVTVAVILKAFFILWFKEKIIFVPMDFFSFLL